MDRYELLQSNLEARASFTTDADPLGIQ